jgi:hypothetical protein
VSGHNARSFSSLNGAAKCTHSSVSGSAHLQVVERLPHITIRSENNRLQTLWNMRHLP